MANDKSVRGIDPTSWRVEILPTPKGLPRGAALGFCGGHPVGRAESPRKGASGCWWPKNNPELLKFGKKTSPAAGSASGRTIPGRFREGDSGTLRALVWTLDDAKLTGRELECGSYKSCWATACAGEVVIGIGIPHSEPGKRSPNRGLVWRNGSLVAEISATSDVSLTATDGVRLAGSIMGRATLWPSASGDALDLSPKGMTMSEVHDLDGELQIGSVFKGMRAQPAVWRGSAASFSSLIPKGFQTGVAYSGAGGFQVGYVREKEMTANGTPGSCNRAVLWQSDANRWIDLNALLPEKKYNASIAWSIELSGDDVRVCGQADYVEIQNSGTKNESHAVPVSHPVLWTAKLLQKSKI